MISVAFYEAKCREMKTANIRGTQAIVMRIIWMMYDKILVDKNANSTSREKADVEDIDEYLKRYGVKLLGYFAQINVKSSTRSGLLRTKSFRGTPRLLLLSFQSF